MKQEKRGKNNLWKWAFFLLLALNIAFFGVVASRILGQAKTSESQTVQTPKTDIKLGLLTTNRQQLNQAIATYLKTYQTKEMSYQVYATSSSLIFEGGYQLLGNTIPLYLYFQPYRLESGALQLKVTSVAVGSLPLPIKEVLNYIKTSHKLPKFVDIQPKKEVMTINIQSLENEAGIYLKTQKFDLPEDEIIFEIFKKNGQ